MRKRDICLYTFLYVIMFISIMIFSGHAYVKYPQTTICVLWAILILLVFVFIFELLYVWRHKERYKLFYQSKIKLQKFTDNLAYIIRDKYGKITDENLQSVRMIANTLYKMSTGDYKSTMMKYGSKEFFNELIENAS